MHPVTPPTTTSIITSYTTSIHSHSIAHYPTPNWPFSTHAYIERVTLSIAWAIVYWPAFAKAHRSYAGCLLLPLLALSLSLFLSLHTNTMTNMGQCPTLIQPWDKLNPLSLQTVLLGLILYQAGYAGRPATQARAFIRGWVELSWLGSMHAYIQVSARQSVRFMLSSVKHVAFAPLCCVKGLTVRLYTDVLCVLDMWIYTLQLASYVGCVVSHCL